MRVPCVAPRSETEPEVDQRGLQDRHQNPLNSLGATAPPAAAPTSAASAVKPPLPLRPLYGTRELPPVPAPFTPAEIELFEATLQTQDPFPKPLYKRLADWRDHCGCSNSKHPLPVTYELLQDRNPWRPKRPAAAPIDQDPPSPS